MIIKITKENFNETIKGNDKILVDFWASWCSPCRMLGSVLEQFNNENENVVIGKINVDEEPELSQAFNISSIPFMVLFENGQAKKNHVGFTDLNGIKEIWN